MITYAQSQIPQASGANLLVLCVMSIIIGVGFFIWGRAERGPDELTVQRRRKVKRRQIATANLLRNDAPVIEPLSPARRDHGALFRAGRGVRVGRGR